MTDSEKWSDEIIQAINELENKYDIFLCSSDHLQTWIDRCEEQEKIIKKLQNNISKIVEFCNNKKMTRYSNSGRRWKSTIRKIIEE